MSTKKRYCCFNKCDADAVFMILDMNDNRDVSMTDACEAHLGALIGSADPVDPIGPWTVSVIKDE